VRIIYSPTGTNASGLRCRTCWGFTYRSRREHRQWAYETLTAPAERLKRQLRYAKPRERRRLLELTTLIATLPAMLSGD
jgi:hypothetical protein